MYHPRFKGRYYDMGSKFGNILKKNDVKFPIKLDDFQMKFGIESGRLLREYFPEAAEEIRGVTDVTGADNAEFTAWMMCMGCCMYNLDDRINNEVRGCTAFSFEQDGLVYYGRDNDLPLFLKDGCKSVFYQPETGNAFILNTSSFINGEEGLNRHGLAVAMTFVMPKIEEITPGLNSVFIVRYLLEKCKTTDEAVDSLKNIPIASSCNILLADTGGNMLVAECNPSGIFFRQPESGFHGRRFVIAVNHFTSEEMRDHDACSGKGEYYSYERYQTVHDALIKHECAGGLDFSEKILSGKYGFICRYEKELNFDTVWSSVFNLNECGIYRAEGNPGRSKFIRDFRLFAHM
jgi:predicted choloylglycine hydrolase